MLRHTAVLRLLHAGVEATVIAVWQPVEQSPEIWPAVPVTARAEQRNPRVGGGDDGPEGYPDRPDARRIPDLIGEFFSIRAFSIGILARVSNRLPMTDCTESDADGLPTEGTHCEPSS